MLQIIEKSSESNNDFSFIDFSDNQQKGYFLFTNILDDSKYKSKINKYILETILAEQFSNIDNNIEENLVDVFTRLNLFLYNKLREYNIYDRGISLLFCFIDSDNIYLVQFGRYLTGVLSDKGFQQLGSSWENFHIKSAESLNLLGYIQNDIPVSIIKHKVKLGEQIVISHSDIAKNIEANNYAELLQKLNKFKSHSIILKRKKYIDNSNINFLNQKRNIIVASFFIIITIAVLVYSWRGNNSFADRIEIQKEINKDYKKNSLMERVQTTIIDVQKAIEKRDNSKDIKMLEHFQNSLETLSEMLISPARSIELTDSKQFSINEKITAPPYFDLKHIYLIANKSIKVISKKKMELVNTINISGVVSMKLLDANLLQAQTEDKMICINRHTTEVLWEHKLKTQQYKKFNNSVNISVMDDRRLSSSISIVYDKNQISILNDMNGKKLFSVILKKDIVFISSYDNIEKSLYIVVDNGLLKMDLEIR